MKGSIFEIYTILFDVVGLPIRSHESMIYAVYCRFVRFLMFTLCMNVLITLFQNLNNTAVLMETLAVGGSICLGIVKYICIWFVVDDFKDNLKLLDSEIFARSKEQRSKKEQKLTKKCEFFLACNFFILNWIPIAYIIVANIPIIKQRRNDPTSWPLPFGAVPFFDVAKSPNYEIALFYQNVTTFLLYTTYTGSLAACSSVVTRLSFQCRILQDCIREVIVNRKSKMRSNNDDGTVLEWKYLKDDVRSIVFYHNAITNLAQKFSDVFSIIYLIDYGTFVAIISCYLYYALLLNPLSINFVQVVGTSMNGVILAFIAAYWPEAFVTSYAGIGDACYDVDFVHTDQRFQKALISIIQRSQKPVCFMIGNVTELTFETFISVIKAAYAFFMFLYQTQDEKKMNTDLNK